MELNTLQFNFGNVECKCNYTCIVRSGPPFTITHGGKDAPYLNLNVMHNDFSRRTTITLVGTCHEVSNKNSKQIPSLKLQQSRDALRDFFKGTGSKKIYKTFWCTKFIYVPRELCNKHDETAVKEILVVIDVISLCYQIYFPVINSTISTREGTFIEEPYEHLKINSEWDISSK